MCLWALSPNNHVFAVFESQIYLLLHPDPEPFSLPQDVLLLLFAHADLTYCRLTETKNALSRAICSQQDPSSYAVT